MTRAQWSMKALSHCSECWLADKCFIKRNIRKALDEEVQKGIEDLLSSNVSEPVKT